MCIKPGSSLTVKSFFRLRFTTSSYLSAADKEPFSDLIQIQCSISRFDINNRSMQISLSIADCILSDSITSSLSNFPIQKSTNNQWVSFQFIQIRCAVDSPHQTMSHTSIHRFILSNFANDLWCVHAIYVVRADMSSKPLFKHRKKQNHDHSLHCLARNANKVANATDRWAWKREWFKHVFQNKMQTKISRKKQKEMRKLNN